MYNAYLTSHKTGCSSQHEVQAKSCISQNDFPISHMGKCLPSTGCGFYCCKPETLMVSLSFLSYPHHGANLHFPPQWYEMVTPRMNILSRIIAQQVLTYPPTQAFIDGLETQIFKWKQIQAIYLLSHLGGSEVVFLKKS